MDKTAIVILAGGAATRFPGKLERLAGGKPLIVRIFNNLRECGPTVVSANQPFAPSIEALLPCAKIPDRWRGAGPLAGIVSAMELTSAARIFVAAGDMPFVDRTTFEELHAGWQDGDEAVVVRTGSGIQPLLALYARIPFLRAARPLLDAGTYSVRAVLPFLATRYVTLANPLHAVNINTETQHHAHFDREPALR
ncbi:MAG: hypothetical protein NVS1B14_03430 [Vulcanimicrobiaceae bacterium]